MHALNLIIFAMINGGATQSSALDAFVVFFTTYVAYGMLVLVAIWVLIWIPSHKRELHARVRALRHAIEFVFITIATYAIVQTIKIITVVPRPFVAIPDINALLPYQSGYSFPSMHAALSVAIATIITLHYRRLGVLLYVFAIAVALSRIYVGVHYPKDVIVGGMLGFAIAGLLHIWFCRFHTDK